MPVSWSDTQMVGESIYVLSIVFALVTGTAAALLAMLSWEILRYSPLGRVIFGLGVFQILFILYHVVVLLTPNVVTIQHLIHAGMYTIAALLIWWLAWVEREIQRETETEANPS